jgi:phosphoglycolate phosphatase-like HAD superfamily hydrolase
MSTRGRGGPEGDHRGESSFELLGLALGPQRGHVEARAGHGTEHASGAQVRYLRRHSPAEQGSESVGGRHQTSLDRPVGIGEAPPPVGVPQQPDDRQAAAGDVRGAHQRQAQQAEPHADEAAVDDGEDEAEDGQPVDEDVPERRVLEEHLPERVGRPVRPEPVLHVRHVLVVEQEGHDPERRQQGGAAEDAQPVLEPGLVHVDEPQEDRAEHDEDGHDAVGDDRQGQHDRGPAAVLADLQAAGVRLAVATSKAEPTAKRIIEHFGLDHHFEVVAGASLDGTRAVKADVVAHALAQLEPLPERMLMDGDRAHDVEGASAHGIDTVVVEWGYGADDFVDGEATATATHVATVAALREVLGV